MADPTQDQGGFSAAIARLLQALQSALAPGQLTHRGAYLDQHIEQDDPQNTGAQPLTPPAAVPGVPLGPKPPGGRLGNQSPGLGNSF